MFICYNKFMLKLIYPGTFDPITKGHTNLIKRLSKMFDKLILGIYLNKSKKTLFNIKERILMSKKVLSKFNNVEIKSFNCLLKEFMLNQHSNVIIKGLRNILDFERELRMASLNLNNKKSVETFFITSYDKYKFVSSTKVKEIVKLGGNIKKFVVPYIENNLKKKLNF